MVDWVDGGLGSTPAKYRHWNGKYDDFSHHSELIFGHKLEMICQLKGNWGSKISV